MMHMSFWWGADLGDFLIKGLNINTSSSMILLCLCLFILSILVEAMKVSLKLCIFIQNYLFITLS